MDRDNLSPTFEGGSDIRDRATDFACRVVRFSGELYRAGGAARVMAPHLVGCSMSVAAMLEEARAAESRRDFISKCSTALKEAREALVRLRICLGTDIGPPEEAAALAREANELVGILTAIVRNTRRNAGLEPTRRPRTSTSGANS
jgi:four helix bundle protein